MSLLQHGGLLHFYLEENSSTGYIWMLEGENDRVSVTRRNEESPEGEPRLLGAPAKVHVTIAALKPGTSKLRLLYARPWEKPLKPVRVLVIEFTAADNITEIIQP